MNTVFSKSLRAFICLLGLILCTFPVEIQASEDMREKVRVMYRTTVDKTVADNNTPAALYRSIDQMANTLTLMQITSNAFSYKTMDTAIRAYALDFYAMLMLNMAHAMHDQEQSAASAAAVEKAGECYQISMEGAYDFDIFATESGILEMKMLAQVLDEEKFKALDYYLEIADQRRDGGQVRDKMPEPMQNVAHVDKKVALAQSQPPVSQSQTDDTVAGFFQRHAPAEQATEQASAQPSQAEVTPTWRMTDELYEQFTESEEFCYSETLLNTTWKLVKSSLKKQQYQEILEKQRIWLETDRNTLASQFASKMTPVEAFTQVNFDKANELAQLLQPAIVTGNYTYVDADGGMVLTKKADNNYLIEIGTVTGQNICSLSGTLMGKEHHGWGAVSNITDGDENDQIRILFYQNRAYVAPQRADAFCGMNATLAGHYTLQR